MNLRESFKVSFALTAVLTVALFGIGTFPVRAAEVCEYQLYVRFIDQSMRVCEMPAEGQACGNFRRADGKESDRVFPHRDFKRTEGSCSRNNVIGVCVLSNSSLVFYEGDLGALEIGCANMQGDWRMPSMAELRDTNFFNSLQ